MPTIVESLEQLDGMVTNHATIPEIRSQIAFIQREVAVLQTEKLGMDNACLALHDEVTKLKAAQAQKLPDPPNFGSQPYIKGRMET